MLYNKNNMSSRSRSKSPAARRRAKSPTKARKGRSTSPRARSTSPRGRSISPRGSARSVSPSTRSRSRSVSPAKEYSHGVDNTEAIRRQRFDLDFSRRYDRVSQHFPEGIGLEEYGRYGRFGRGGRGYGGRGFYGGRGYGGFGGAGGLLLGTALGTALGAGLAGGYPYYGYGYPYYAYPYYPPGPLVYYEKKGRKDQRQLYDLEFAGRVNKVFEKELADEYAKRRAYDTRAK